jgi:hypothetical protein
MYIPVGHNFAYHKNNTYCRPSYERTNRGSGWSDNADCPVLPNNVFIYSPQKLPYSNALLYK